MCIISLYIFKKIRKLYIKNTHRAMPVRAISFLIQTSLAAGRYKFNILDQGSVLTAIEDASINLTDSVQ